MIRLREATINDLEILHYWDQQAHIIDSDPNDDWNWEYELTRSPEWRMQLLAENNGQAIGFIQIIDPAKEETHYWGDIDAGKRAIDIWIGEEKNLGKGYGTEMMKLALEICFKEEAVNEVIIDPLESNKKAIHFYKKLGFQYVEIRMFGMDKCEVYAITRAQWLHQEV